MIAMHRQGADNVAGMIEPNADAPTARPSFIARHPIKLLILSLILLLYFAACIMDAWATRQLRAVESLIRRSGEPLTLAEIDRMRPVVADADNMALPLVKLGEALSKEVNTNEFRERMELVPLLGKANPGPSAPNSRRSNSTPPAGISPAMASRFGNPRGRAIARRTLSDDLERAPGRDHVSVLLGASATRQDNPDRCARGGERGPRG